MTKKLEIFPETLFAPGQIDFAPIPLNQYSKTVRQEKTLYKAEGLKAIYHDMIVLRTFETIIDQIKKIGEYQGVAYKHAGPAHLSIGQEAAAVGQAWSLDIDDAIFGSHRSHSEILAKGLSAIRKLDDDKLMEIMRGFFDGATLAAVEKGHDGDVKSLARKFLVYGAYAEIFARTTGFNKGWGGSMHAFFIPFGIFPNNAIVGGSGSIAPGAALFKRVNRKPGIVICNIGDASFGCGPVWEGISFASMDQYRNLWDQSLGGGLPIMFNCFNNSYGMGGQTCGETMGYQFLARIGAGVNPEQMHAERVNGYDPLAVADAVARKKQILLEGRGPVLLDTITYRIAGHSPVRRFQLPLAGRDQAVRGRGRHPGLPAALHRGESRCRRRLRGHQGRDRGLRLRHVQARHRPVGLALRDHGVGLHRDRDLLEQEGRGLRHPRAGSSSSPCPRTSRCSASPRRNASPSTPRPASPSRP